jgi:hypothetical protein
MPSEIEDVGVVLAPPAMQATGLLAWATVLVAGIRIDGLVVRRRLSDDRLSVTFPMRRAENGVLHPVVAIVDDAQRRRIEVEVLAAYLEAARRVGRNPQ